MEKREVYRKALMLTRILKNNGIEISVTKARELISEGDSVTLNHDFFSHVANATSEKCRDDFATVVFYGFKTIADIAFAESPGRSTSCKMLLSASKDFYGVEISNPYRNASRLVTISDTMLENIGSILGYEILHALAHGDLSAYADNDFIDRITGK